MDYRSLGRTGVKVSPLCLGTMNFGWKTPPEEAQRIVDQALAAGLNFIDTADVYGCGASEEIVGEALRRNGQRQRVVLATKVHGVMADDDPNAGGNSHRHIIRASLHRLKTDYIDLYQLHRPQPDIPIDETLGALDDLVRKGYVRYLGTSTFAAWQLMEALSVARASGRNRFVCEQPPYNLLDRRAERELLPMARTYGVAIIPYSPLAGGLLTGNYRRGGPFPEGSRYAEVKFKRRLDESAFEVLDGLEPLLEAKGCDMSQFALAWCVHQPGVTGPIIGPRTPAQLDDNLRALEITVTDEDRAFVDALIPPGRMASPFYELDARPHLYR